MGGNILSKSKYAYTRGSLGTVLSTVTYGYGDSSWQDLLTSYRGKTITYDSIGNPLDDGTWDYVWEHGRQLKSMEGASTKWTYTYDANGQRLTKTNNTLTYHYIYNDMQLMYMKVTQNTSTVCEMYFQYGQTGLMAIQYISSSLTDTYYVVTNAQGDVVALVDGNGTVVVNYTYDAWGKLQAMTGSKASTVGKYNPIRYRGYVYDTETQLYYLNTRYYNPDMGRFINADSYASTGDELTGANMFAYCGNNPVNYYDPTGHAPEWMDILCIVGVAALAIAVTVASFGAASAAIAPITFAYFGMAANTTFAIMTAVSTVTTLGIAAFAVADIQEVVTDGESNYLSFLGGAYDDLKGMFYFSSYMIGYASQFAQPGWGRQTVGTKDAPKESTPYASYVKTSANGNCTTVYNGKGQAIIRYDFSHSHFGMQPHMHKFQWWMHNGAWQWDGKTGTVFPYEVMDP